METQWLPVSLVVWFTALAGALDARQQARFVQLGTGLLFARGRRTVTSWLRGGAAGRDYKRYYYLLGSVGRKTSAIAGALLRILLHRLPGDGPGTPLVFAIDDSPTKRYGPHVEGAGKHHNPTPGPAGSPFLYGHVWVCLARLVRHSLWGAIALPILSHLYIRAKDVGWMAAYYGWQFHTKLELAAAQIEWLVQQWGPDHLPIWVVTDGAYVKRPFLKRMLGAGVTVISRLRCDAALWSLPPVVDPGQKKGRGRPPKYGKDRIDLARRAAQTRGWQTGLFSLYGRMVVKKYKTLLSGMTGMWGYYYGQGEVMCHPLPHGMIGPGSREPRSHSRWKPRVSPCLSEPLWPRPYSAESLLIGTRATDVGDRENHGELACLLEKWVHGSLPRTRSPVPATRSPSPTSLRDLSGLLPR